jgi:formylmethanofuran dehydrogenase subunit B
LHGLARATGAITDPAAGRALAQVLRAQQDRGGYTTTLAEVRERADLIVLVGSWAPDRTPELLPRALAGRSDAPPALVALGCQAPADVAGLPVAQVPARHDLFHTLAELAALVAGRAVREPAPALAALAAQLQAARYAVLVWEPAQLGPHAALLIERLQQLIGLLNVQGRAAGFPLGGGDGAATVNQVFTWLSGLPLRSRRSPLGLEHEPLRFDAATLLSQHEVDALLWVSSFRAAEVPALAGGWRIVLGLPALAAQLGDEARTVFIPVATPGVHTAGHLCRADGVVMLPLHAAMQTGLPTLADVITRITQALPQEVLA